MFAEVKAMVQNQVSGTGYDDEIILWTKAALLDLTMDQIVLPGVFSVSKDDETGAITDNSTIEDEYVFAACATFCCMNIGNPPNHDNLMKTYKTIKGNMRNSSKYKEGADG